MTFAEPRTGAPAFTRARNSTPQNARVDGRVAKPWSFALTDPSMRLSRTGPAGRRWLAGRPAGPDAARRQTGVAAGASPVSGRPANRGPWVCTRPLGAIRARMPVAGSSCSSVECRLLDKSPAPDSVVLVQNVLVQKKGDAKVDTTELVEAKKLFQPTMDADNPAELPELRFRHFRLDPVRRVLLDDGRPARLGARALDLLLLLVQHRKRVVGKNELFDWVWPGLVVEENNLQQHISALRKLLGPQAIVTVPGRGYQFAERIDEPVTTAPVADIAPARDSAPPLVPDLGPLIGREVDLGEVRARLAQHTLVTLVGPGGIGKTRLAWAAARTEAGRWSGGVWRVELAALDQAALLPAAVAQALGIVLAPATRAGDGATAVAASLRQQRMLLLLDNCERLLEAVADLIEALRSRAPDVHVLATSQEPLRLAHEQVMRLAPLDDTAAVQLFVARALAAERRFRPTDAELMAVGEICRRLDGVPLAVELAAARVPLLGVAGLRQRLDEGLRILANGPARAPPRQQTLRAALDWSHGLLDGSEQVVFRRLAVFSGGFSPFLAQQVLSDADFESWAVLDHLGALVDKSLLMADSEPGQEPRCRLLEPTRAHALERLNAAGEAPRLRLRHAQTMVGLLQAFEQDMVHARHFDGLLRPLLAETDNMRAAMAWLTMLGQGQLAGSARWATWRTRSSRWAMSMRPSPCVGRPLHWPPNTAARNGRGMLTRTWCRHC
ncbi:ATP-binding protein [Piscinibacter sp.]|uniref:ATP-binding protein n=1 Tax=Piscinibacter sp. TaxID=1903157 RepID=UPI002BBEAAF6|nr:winged helix-turn-helix domain-containing protein [Albitalea sp.]HUG24219.1 winged helix-turn-helix domain-containing protein [Albitalea sp.]